MIKKKDLETMKPGACLVNTSRGGIVNEKDLEGILRTGHLSGVALDVFETEPLPEAHLFWRHPNVTITPHAASLTDPVSAVQFVAENIRRHQNGKRLKHTILLTDRL